MNKVILIGRLTKDPELRTTESNKSVSSFSLAVDSFRRDSQGENQADFINCVAWEGLAENLAKYMKKGSKIAVEGRIQTRSYDAKDGTKRYVTEVVATSIEFLESKKDSSSNTSFDDNSNTSYNPFNISTEEPVFNSSNYVDEIDDNIVVNDDDIPF